MDEDEQIASAAVIDWLGTFELPLDVQVTSLGDLSDGYILSVVLSQIAPSYFESKAVEAPVLNGDITMCVANVNKLVKLIDGYYRYVLRKNAEASNFLDINAIANKDADETLKLVELVLGAAVMCNDTDARSAFIQNIFSLDHLSQTFLKDLIQSVMSETHDLNDDDVIGTQIPGVAEDELEEAVIRAEEAAKHLREEKQRLLMTINELESSNQMLATENQKLMNALDELQAEKLTAPSAGALEHKSAALLSLQIELDEVKRELDLKVVEIENLKSDLVSSKRHWENSAEVVQKLTMENNQMADELDVARDKAIKLAKAEATIEKYQQKLEEMTVLKKQNKELSSKLDQYLDQINQLESSNKGMATLQRLVDQYKDKAVEIEREKFEALSVSQMKDLEISKLKAELASVVDSRNILEDEVGSLRIELSQLQETSSQQSNSATLSEDLESTETVTSLKEKLKKLEFEVKALRSTATESENSGASDDTALLHAEIDDLKRIKKEREDYILGLRKTLAETQNELQKANRIALDAETKSPSAAAAKDAELKLGQSTHTIRQLEDRLKEQESTINRLEQEKSKLEIYARKTLSTFRDKFMTKLTTLTEEKKASEDLVQSLTEKLEANQETFRREERILLSSMYELGMKIMDRNITSHMQRGGGYSDSNETSATSNGKGLSTPIRR